MMTPNTYKKTCVALILILAGTCDAFVVDVLVSNSKPALLAPPTRIFLGWHEVEPGFADDHHHGQSYYSQPMRKEYYEPLEPVNEIEDLREQIGNLRRELGEYDPPSSVAEQPEPPSPPPSKEQQHELEQQIEEYKTELKRMKSKHEENTQAFVTLLDVSDNLARAIEAVPAQEKETNAALQKLCEGLKLTEKGLERVFDISGIVKYGAVGEPFDHNIHHALCEFSDPEKEPDTVGHVIKAGYLLNGERVLRYAEVAVVKSEPSSSESCELDLLP